MKEDIYWLIGYLRAYEKVGNGIDASEIKVILEKLEDIEKYCRGEIDFNSNNFLFSKQK